MQTSDPAERASAGRLTVSLEGNFVQELWLSPAVLTIGRSPDNALPLPDPKVSRQHAEVRLTAEGPILTDLGSANGTFVEGTRLLAHQPYRLVSGTAFAIGSYSFVYEAPAPLQAAAPEVLPAVELLPIDPPSPAATAPAHNGPIVVAPEMSPAATGRDLPLAGAVNLIALPPPAPPPPPRATLDAPNPPGPWSGYLRDLPIIFQDNDFLARFLMIMESIWEPLEWRQDHVAMYFDPKTCPPAFLTWLASWLDPALETNWPEERLRGIVARAMELYRWRGTRYGLASMIELCTGLAPRISDDPDQPFCFRVRLEVPRTAGVDRRIVEGVIQAQKPAHAGYVLEMAVQS